MANDGRVMLTARIDPVVRDYAREAARMSGLEFSQWVERAIRTTMARESADRAFAELRALDDWKTKENESE